MRITSRGRQRSSSRQRVKFVGSLSAPHNTRGHSLKKFLPLPKLAINIESHVKCVHSLKRVLGRRHRLLTRDQKLERVPESGFLKPDRDTGPILSPSFEAR